MESSRNQNGIGEKELLVVSFGTSYYDSRRLTIGAVEEVLEREFPDYAVRRGFTSRRIIERLKKRDGLLIDDTDQALKRAEANGVKRLVIQPTHLMHGLEYQKLAKQAAAHRAAFDEIVLGEPLLASERDFQIVIEAVTEELAPYDDGKTAVCLMGHGTEDKANQVYEKIQEKMRKAGHQHYYIGTVEANPGVEEVAEAVKAGNYSRVVLAPFMLVAGDHANNDMAGDEEDSWRSVFSREGYQVICLLKGLGELEKIRFLFAEHAREAMNSLK